MAQLIAPPQSPAFVALDDGDGFRRARFHLWQIAWAAGTLLATGWCYTLGPIPAIVATLIAKHILVAVLIIGLDRDAGQVRN